MRQFFYGVIEGFYGRQWSWDEREQYASFLVRHGFDCYIYAPKGDRCLRSDWRTLHSRDEARQLARLAQCYHEAGLRWGVGLSTLGLMLQYTADDCRQLQQKVRALNDMEPDILCILFDDTRGDFDNLAQRQLDITQDILAVSRATHHIVCPTYYSFDPVLERVFGNRPPAYLETLGQGLAAEVDIFWTGNRVISDCYEQADLQRITRLLNRPPVLWDNYPVNDGKQTSGYLHLKPYTGRPHQLQQWTRGHIVNPMNQPRLSQLVLQSLQQLYQRNERYDENTAFDAGLTALVSKPLADMIKQDWSLFQQKGLMELDAMQRDQLKARYLSCDEPVALEIIDWLDDGYQFDPNCLTD